MPEDRRKAPQLPHAITIALLEATADDALEELLFKYVLRLRTDSPEQLDTLTESLSAHYIVFLLDIEVLNGGFNQFWFNSPQLATYAASAFDYMEIPEAATLAREAEALYEAIRHQHEAARKSGSIEAFMSTYNTAPFGALDRAYFSRESEWRQLRISYIRRHPEEFVHP